MRPLLKDTATAYTATVPSTDPHIPRCTPQPVILAVVTDDARTGGARSVFRFEDPRQEEIFARLNRLVGSGPALFFYRDACRHMAAEYPMDTVRAP